MTTPKTKNKDVKDYTGQEFVITREFDAPRELVFKAWTDPKQLAQWWGPRGFTNPVCQWDAQPGKAIYVVMRGPNGTDYPMGGEFREIVAPERLVLACGALDEKGKLLFEFLHTVTFVERNGKTTLTVRSRVTMVTSEANKYIGGFEAGMTQSLERLSDLVANTGDREIRITRDVDAPRELVWEAMTNPEHVVHWWGPRGFSTTIEKMDFRVGGVWKHLMRGPDGAEYPNESVFTEIVKPERIRYSHGGSKKGAEVIQFKSTWTFDALDGDKTKVTIHLVFPTVAARDRVVKEYGAIEGGKQTLQCLSEYLSTMPGATEFVISRVFDAPPELVWQAWTDPKCLANWWGPRVVKMTVCDLDVRPGGAYRIVMRAPDGNDYPVKGVYRELVPHQRLVMTMDCSGHPASWHDLVNPDRGNNPNPAGEMVCTATMEKLDGKTKLTVTMRMESAAIRDALVKMGMNQGWSHNLERLAELLAKG